MRGSIHGILREQTGLRSCGKVAFSNPSRDQMKTKIFLTAILLLVYAAAILVPFEPKERRPGGRLSGPDATSTNVSWDGRKQILVETSTWYLIPHSVTTVAWVRDGIIYVPCGACSTKRWPKNVASRPRVRLQIAGEIYHRRAVRVTDREELYWVLEVPPKEHPTDGVAVFRMET